MFIFILIVGFFLLFEYGKHLAAKDKVTDNEELFLKAYKLIDDKWVLRLPSTELDKKETE